MRNLLIPRIPSLGSPLTLPFIGLLAFAGAFVASAAEPVVEVEWTAALPCEEAHSRPIPGQPSLGLALYRFDCPGMPARFVSAKRKMTVQPFAAQLDLPRGATPTPEQLRLLAPMSISRPGEMPLGAEALSATQTRRLIPAGDPLLAKDFEPRRLWIGGQQITLLIRLGGVRTTLPAVALGVGRQGEQASAKTENGKTFSGVVAMENDAPVLLIRQ